MILSAAEIEEPRSPSELRAFVSTIKERVYADREELHRGILKKKLYKQFLEEIVPLSCFAPLVYEDHVRVQPVLGNQAYDALVFNAYGKVCDCIEITAPHDGESEATDARRVVSLGYGLGRTGEPGDDLHNLRPRVLETCRAKAMKDYGDCTLVVSIGLEPPFVGFESRLEELLDRLTEDLRGIDFKARRVFLLVLPDRLVPIQG